MQGLSRLAFLAALAVGCATAPVRYAARSTPATATTADDESLLAGGFVSLGKVEGAVERERCRGTEQAPTDCRRVDSTGLGDDALLVSAARRGGDVVRITRHEHPRTVPWIEHTCQAAPSGSSPIFMDPNSTRITGDGVCIDVPNTVGIRRLVVSEGTAWKHDPGMVANERLVRAVAIGDEARVATLLSQLRSPDAYLHDPPLLVAAATATARFSAACWPRACKRGATRPCGRRSSTDTRRSCASCWRPG